MCVRVKHVIHWKVPLVWKTNQIVNVGVHVILIQSILKSTQPLIMTFSAFWPHYLGVKDGKVTQKGFVNLTIKWEWPSRWHPWTWRCTWVLPLEASAPSNSVSICQHILEAPHWKCLLSNFADHSDHQSYFLIVTKYIWPVYRFFLTLPPPVQQT